MVAIDWSIIVGCVLVAGVAMGSIFRFVRLRLCSAGLANKQASIVSAVLIIVTVMFILQKLKVWW